MLGAGACIRVCGRVVRGFVKRQRPLRHHGLAQACEHADATTSTAFAQLSDVRWALYWLLARGCRPAAGCPFVAAHDDGDGALVFAEVRVVHENRVERVQCVVPAAGALV